MSKFYEVSKVLDKRTDAHGRVQYLIRWRGYGRKYDSSVDKSPNVIKGLPHNPCLDSLDVFF